ncbi:membrane protein insertase YidC [Inmirania thermothiophila]|uniref:Membrane protein insertase YidC n=1 Tax=Inmirania thermothiophila TaxID=1750597 RepID=A0A3N1Y6B9_9GAMM|nr:membrane protein insertase YidC [Inmirania thermothiophila]ROR34353.1 protein translocase subunit yidC [Inmirania thermothiophila]
MDNQRLFLFVAFSLVVLLLWEAWQRDYAPRPQAPAPVAEAPRAAEPPAPSAPPQTALPRGERVRVVTDVLDLEIDTLGGDLRRADLRRYPVSLDRPEVPFRLLDDAPERLFVAQAGLVAADLPRPRIPYRAEAATYRLADGQDRLEVRLRWQGPGGLEVDKVYTFRRGSYVVELAFEVRNRGAAPRTVRPYLQLQRVPVAQGSRYTGAYTFAGAAYYSPETKYEKLDFEDIARGAQPQPAELTDGWVAMVQHYFFAAWIPPGGTPHRYYTRAVGDGPRYLIGVTAPDLQVPPGGAARYAARAYVGPKLQEVIPEVAEGLEFTVDYGLLTVLAKPIFWLLRHIHDLVGNWGWAIVILVVLLKAAFYKLSEASYRSMANMRRLAPRLQALRERYGDDKQRLNQAMMELYKKERINPLGGCLPILVQIPFFIALYWVLLESVELRHAPFVLWIRDLSARDPYFVLPILMGATMFLQQRLNPQPPDPIQARIMMAMPVVFTVFFLFFPSGLVLYWLVNNLLSIAQQWVITRRIEQASR